MFRKCMAFFARPRQIMFTPPPLARRTGDFRCRHCKFRWNSQNVWVTKETHRCYQGESCSKCGELNKPYYIGFLKESVFNTRVTPHSRKPGASTKRSEKRKVHFKYKKFRVMNKGRH